MKKEDKLKPLLGPLEAIQTFFESGKYHGMIIGGVAASILGKPRFTKDVDLVVMIEDMDFSAFLDKTKQVGLEPRIKDVEAFAHKSNVFLLRHKGSGIPIDISIAILPFEKKAISRKQSIRIDNLTITIPTPEDLIIFKAVAHRPQDLVDIQEMLKLHQQLDWKYIRKWVKEFASLLEMPEIYNDIKVLFKKPIINKASQGDESISRWR
ncbi:MAG: nucleotidyl transferase AbiEii/AbiGii toxin family protein [Pseudomonadota bacterium]